MSDHKRTAREIKINNNLLNNENINIKVGVVENREAPDTVYIFTSFWLDPIDEYKNTDQKILKNILDKELNKIYNNSLKNELINNKYFTKEKENIFIKNIPENFNYNKKRNYISVELYLHTRNLENEIKLPLSVKKNTELFDEAVRLSNILSNSEAIKQSKYFTIYKSSN